MKSKKKLLIAMAAMSVAAIGAGTVSTFAWYTASAAVKLQNTSDVGYSIHAGTSTAEAENVNITFTVAHKTGAPVVELSTVDGSTVKHGTMKNGHDKEATAWDGKNKTGHILISQYDVTAVLDAGATPGQKAYLNNKSYTFKLESVGNARILSYNTAIDITTEDGFANADAKDEMDGSNDSKTPTVTITFGANGVVSTYTISNPYYVVRTNNPDGMEAMTAAAFDLASTSYAVGDEVVYSGNVYRFHTAKAAAGWDDSKVTLLGAATADYVAGNYKKGDVVKYTTNGNYYRCTADKTGSSNPSTETSYWEEVKLHSDDKIQVKSGQTVEKNP